MSIVLLLLGVVTTLAGLVLMASGVNVREGAFDGEVMTPATIASVGGLLLIGIGFAVRELRRIERALAAKPMPSVTRAGEARATDSEDVSIRLPLPPKPAAKPQPVSAEANHAVTPGEGVTAERVRVKFPSLPRVESPPVSEESIAEVKHVAVAGRGGNGGAPLRVTPRMEARSPPASAPDAAKAGRLASFLSLGPRSSAQAAPDQLDMPPQPGIEPASSETVPAPKDAAAGLAGAVSVLKSGVVEGMAYTLYSDGSIEAQLPQGTLRFGSITALRDHIEGSE
jgi:hypothetical protein